MISLRALFRPFDRREAEVKQVPKDRRKTAMEAANHRLSAAIEDLNATVSMGRKEFCELIQREGDCPRDKK